MENKRTPLGVADRAGRRNKYERQVQIVPYQDYITSGTERQA